MYGGHGLPSRRDHPIAPLAAFSPYSQSVSVATMTVFPATTGCAKTCPLTAVENSWPNRPLRSTAGVRLVSVESQPSRRLFCDAVTSAARAAGARIPGTIPVTSPAAASASPASRGPPGRLPSRAAPPGRPVGAESPWP